MNIYNTIIRNEIMLKITNKLNNKLELVGSYFKKICDNEVDTKKFIIVLVTSITKIIPDAYCIMSIIFKCKK